MTNMVVRRSAQVNPWREIERVRDSLYRAEQDVPRKPVVNISNEESKVVLKAELPGFGPEDLDIQVKENLLTLQAFRTEEVKKEDAEEASEEKKVIFERSFVLPEDLDREGFSAEMKNGLLTLELPRKAKPAPLVVKVKG